MKNQLINSDKEKLAKFLIKNGANVNKEDIYGRTPLDWALFLGKSIKLLLNHRRWFIELFSAILIECSQHIDYMKYEFSCIDHETISKLLLKNGAGDYVERHGRSALDLAVYYSNNKLYQIYI